MRIENQEVPEGQIKLPRPITVNALKITFDAPVDETSTLYNIKLNIFGCFEPIGKLNQISDIQIDMIYYIVTY